MVANLTYQGDDVMLPHHNNKDRNVSFMKRKSNTETWVPIQLENSGN